MKGKSLRPASPTIVRSIDRSLSFLLFPLPPGALFLVSFFVGGLFYAELGWIQGHALCMTLKLLQISWEWGFVAREKIPSPEGGRATEKEKTDVGVGAR